MQQATYEASLTRVMTEAKRRRTYFYVDIFKLVIHVKTHGSQREAVCAPLETMMVGVGKTDDEAVKDLMDCFMFAIDVNTEQGTFDAFMKEIDAIKDDDVRIVNIKQSEPEMNIELPPTWRVKPSYEPIAATA